MTDMTHQEGVLPVGFVCGLIISLVTWNILGTLGTPLLHRLLWTVLAFGGGSVGLILVSVYLQYEYHLYKKKQDTRVSKSSDLEDSGPPKLKLYSPKGFVVFLLVICSLTVIIVMAIAARVGALTEAYILSLIRSSVEIGASSTGIFYVIWYKFRNSRFGQKKQTPPKEIPKTRDQTVLEAEYHRLTEVHLEEIHNLHELTRINFGLNQLKTIDLSPLAGSTSLRELILYMNHLETIDLSPLASCPNLEYLDLTDNYLENIDLTPLSSCLKLNALNIGLNQTSKIDLNPLTESRDLKILTIDGMKLRDVDLSPLRDCKDLEFLKLDDNEFETLDITPLFECEKLIEFNVDKIDLTTTITRDIEEWPKGIRKHKKKIR